MPKKIPEVVLASEAVQVQNIRAVVEYAKETRKIVRELDERIVALKNIVVAVDSKANQLQIQLAAVQQKLYSGGTEEEGEAL